jgi:flagellar protein FliT
MLDLYEAIGAASGRMRDAALAGNWEGLLAAESDCAALIARARARSDPAPLTQAERQRKNEIILRVLADDAEIRRRLHPRLAELDRLLRSAEQRRRVQRSYGH